ncbi:VOC family protein [Actinoplanes couchii]|nr:VOC family protein [Actinoplanes couchii]
MFPILTTPDLGRALGFYRDLLGGEVVFRFPAEGEGEAEGDAAYVGVRLGGSHLGIGLQDEPGDLVNDRVTLWVYAEDCDAGIARLRDAGVPVIQEPTDQTWGERMAVVIDPDGNRVIIASRSP